MSSLTQLLNVIRDVSHQAELRLKTRMVNLENKIIIIVDTAGVERKDINIEIVQTKVKIRAKRFDPFPEFSSDSPNEIVYGELVRDITIPICVVSQNDVVIDYANGLLTITINKNDPINNGFTFKV
jgi:HSP20 family molecular chaperone IbpA